MDQFPGSPRYAAVYGRRRDPGEVAGQLDYPLYSESGSRTIAEYYVGLPLNFGD